MIARQGDQQETRQIGSDQPLQAIGGWDAMLAVERRAMGDQQVGSSKVDAVVTCWAAHAFTIARLPRRLHP